MATQLQFRLKNKDERQNISSTTLTLLSSGSSWRNTECRHIAKPWPLAASVSDQNKNKKTLVLKMKIWRSELNDITKQTVSTFGTLSSEQLNWKPNPNTWSIAQNIDHLIVVNETYYPVLTSLKEGKYKAPFIAKIGFLVSFLGKTVLNAVNSDRQKKMRTFPIWEPSVSPISADILKRFGLHQKELAQKIENAKELIDKRTVISSPANKNIVYKLDTAFDIIISHEKRHLAQAKEILELMKNNTSH